ncbi:hypothetical protein [Streptacidiphilus rugosus]|uniref:hypothetical protein n=1 Tax=Streptacidiphilus rugosus TaxID=405783 RepID=UPI00055CEAF6|nr:hypothetical protein [Streptacidiphilus rugosus]
MARWIIRPERALRRIGVAVLLLCMAEIVALVAVSGRERPMVAGALAGAGLTLAIIVRLRHIVDARTGTPADGPWAQPWVLAAMLDGFPVDQLRPALLAAPEGSDLDLLYRAWACAVMGRDAGWLEARFALDPWIADLLVSASVSSSSGGSGTRPEA